MDMLRCRVCGASSSKTKPNLTAGCAMARQPTSNPCVSGDDARQAAGKVPASDGLAGTTAFLPEWHGHLDALLIAQNKCVTLNGERKRFADRRGCTNCA